MTNNSAEQQARDLLQRMGVPNAQNYLSGDLAELANLIANRRTPRSSCTTCDGSGTVHRADGEYMGECPCGGNAPSATGTTGAIYQARSPEGDPWQEVTRAQYEQAERNGYEVRTLYLAAPASAQPDRGAAPLTDYVLMPKRLTAENGAKGALSGEFKESVTVTCHECGGSGDDAESDNDAECPECKGDGTLDQAVPVTWDTIKDIYAAAVALLGAAPSPASQPVAPEAAHAHNPYAAPSWDHEAMPEECDDDVAHADDWISAVIRDVAELPDRDSPPDAPDMMLVTAEELREIVARHAPAAHADYLAWHKEALTAVRGKLAAVWDGIREAVQQYSGAPCEGEPFDRLDELLSRLSNAAHAQQEAAPAVAHVMEGKWANRLEWLSDEAMAATPVGAKLYVAAVAPSDAKDATVPDHSEREAANASGLIPVYLHRAKNQPKANWWEAGDEYTERLKKSKVANHYEFRTLYERSPAAIAVGQEAANAKDAELATIRAVQEHIVEVVRSFGDISCAAYISTWHKPEAIRAAMAAAPSSEKGGAA